MAVDEAFKRWSVTRLYGDPAQGWDDVLAHIAGRHGDKRVIFFYTDSQPSSHGLDVPLLRERDQRPARSRTTATRTSRAHRCGATS